MCKLCGGKFRIGCFREHKAKKVNWFGGEEEKLKIGKKVGREKVRIGYFSPVSGVTGISDDWATLYS